VVSVFVYFLLVYYRVMLCIARTLLSQDVRPSVRPSHAGILPKRLNTSSNGVEEIHSVGTINNVETSYFKQLKI